MRRLERLRDKPPVNVPNRTAVADAVAAMHNGDVGRYRSAEALITQFRTPWADSPPGDRNQEPSP